MIRACPQVLLAYMRYFVDTNALACENANQISNTLLILLFPVANSPFQFRPYLVAVHMVSKHEMYVRRYSSRKTRTVSQLQMLAFECSLT
jgi:hypothetical protein